MSLILQLDTSTSVCSVSLSKGTEIISFREESEGRNHAALLTVFIQKVLDDANCHVNDLSAIAVSKGPGSYTGLRIGVSVAKGMAYALSIPLISVNTLKMMASGYLIQNPDLSLKTDLLLVPMIDARRMEVYSAIYSTKLEETRPVKAEIIDENSFQKEREKNHLIFFGDGAEKCREVLTKERLTVDSHYIVSSRYMASIAFEKYKKEIFEDVAYFEPFYLKDFIATTPKNKIF